MKSGIWTMLLVRVGPAAIPGIVLGVTGVFRAQPTVRRPAIVASSPNDFMTSSCELGEAIRVATEVNLWRERRCGRLSERWNWAGGRARPLLPRKGYGPCSSCG